MSITVCSFRLRNCWLKDLAKCVVNKPISGLWHSSAIEDPLINVIPVLVRCVMHLLVFLESGLLRSIVHAAYVGFRGCASIVLPQLLLVFLEIQVDLPIVLQGFPIVAIRVSLVAHFCFYFF